MLLSLFLFCSALAQAASQNNHAEEQGFSVRAISDLVFPTAVIGDGPRTVAPGSSESAENASFELIGPPNRAYFFLLPEAVLLTKADRPSLPILITDFKSNPPRGYPGVIGPSGRQTIYVGATRGPVPFFACGGDYQGSFLIVTVY